MMLASFMDALSVAWDTTNIATLAHRDAVRRGHPLHHRWSQLPQEEWDAAMEQISREDTEHFHIELLKYLRGEPNDIRLGTIGMLEAEIAQKIVENDPELLLPIN